MLRAALTPEEGLYLNFYVLSLWLMNFEEGPLRGQDSAGVERARRKPYGQYSVVPAEYFYLW